MKTSFYEYIKSEVLKLKNQSPEEAIINILVDIELSGPRDEKTTWIYKELSNVLMADQTLDYIKSKLKKSEDFMF